MIKDGLEEDGAYLDVDLVEFHDEDFRDITTILKLSDTTKDKLTFTVSLIFGVSDPVFAHRQWFVHFNMFSGISSVHVVLGHPLP